MSIYVRNSSLTSQSERRHQRGVSKIVVALSHLNLRALPSHRTFNNPGISPSYALESGFLMGDARSSGTAAGRALSLARLNQTESARLAFIDATSEDPHDIKCWISFAQVCMQSI